MAVEPVKELVPIVLTYDAAITKHLRPGEQVRWVGRPRQGWSYRWHNRLFLGQVLWALVTLWWVWQMALLSAFDAGFDFHLPFTRPTRLLHTLVLGGGAITAWQLIRDHRRRAGTWYAATDRRLLFVQTNCWPESVIGIEYGEIAQVSLRRKADNFGIGTDAITIKLKHGDVYLANSVVLDYQMSWRAIVLEDLAGAEELRDLIRRKGKPLAEVQNEVVDL